MKTSPEVHDKHIEGIQQDRQGTLNNLSYEGMRYLLCVSHLRQRELEG
ncbi:MAG: hypothetical protein GY801_28615 [bacterium]|nr:hypothetical protein [bacterium]